MTRSRSDVVTVERVIPAEPKAIFDLLADPARHHEIDGSGSVREAKAGSQRLALGSRFGMAMKMGLRYSMSSEVVEFEDDRRIAWQTRGGGRVGRHLGGRIWRYELRPVPGGTEVHESWDIRQETRLFRPLIRVGASTTRKNMAATLERIERVVADS